MAVYKSKGIVLRSIRYGEADRILDLYTPDGGLVPAIAKGIRRTKSRFGARLEPFSCVEFMAYGGRTLDTVTQVEVLRSFRGIRENLGRLEVAGAMIRSMRALSAGGEPDRRVFNLLFHALDALENRETDLRPVEVAFGLKLAMLAGYAPQLDACAGCEQDPGAANGAHLYFSPGLGSLLCAGCRNAAPDAFPLPAGAVEQVVSLARVPIREAALEKKAGESARRVVREHILAHAPGTAVPGTRRPA